MHATGMQTDSAAALADSLASFYGHAMRPSSRLIGEFQRLDLSLTQFKARRPGPTASRPSRRSPSAWASRSPAPAARSTQLVGRGLLDRREDADDRR